MNSEQPNQFICSVCSNEFNDTNRLPKNIPNCNHTFCSVCLKLLIINNPSPVCPIDRNQFEPPGSLEELPTNESLLKSIQKRLLQKFCQQHKEEATLVCLTDKCRICSSCEHSNEHKNHQIKHIRKVKAEVIKKIEDLEVVIDQCEKYPKALEIILEDEKRALHEVAKNKFLKIRKMIDEREQLLFEEINEYLEAKRAKIKATTQEDEILKKITIEKINNLKSDDIDWKYIKNLDEEIVEAQSKLDHMLLRHHNMIYSKQEFDQKLNAFTSILTAEVKKFKFPFTIEEFDKNMKINFCEKRSFGEVFRSHQFLEFVKENNKLFIFIQDAYKQSDIPLSKIKEITEVELDLTEYSKITAQNKWDKICLMFGCLWQKLGRSLKITLKLHAGPAHPKDLINLLSYGYWGDKRLRVKCDILGASDEQSLVEFVSEFLPRLAMLKEIYIHVRSGAKPTDKSIQALISRNELVLRDLESLNMVLDNAPVTDRSIARLLTSVSNLKVFKFHLWKTKITDKCIERFAKETLPELKALQHFELSLIETGVTDASVSELFIPMEGIKIYKLYLGQTKITDKSIEAFIEKTMPTMKSLEYFEFSLRETMINNEKLVQSLLAMRPITYFKLYLANSATINSQGELETFLNPPNKGFFSKLFKG